MATKEFALEEVAKHDDVKDCWLTIHGVVYDVTKFLDDHPGGDMVLLDVAGGDATVEFEDIGHSSDAKKMLDQYKVGVLKK
eukprot:CAMPEP_0201516598 /NCGR_PEP_ID=MMETSP0161_2-20130828/7894_1 /ASSEMBLY_ACC=CAM_ASM_000251 /TAXON_ID=180227 /ORGANISM="Neoparamoeba aestuarina, Strain SoJaBio B1-5/56/2" /LENGTH=80 /DNA_ID=CAMNT_0047913793 /DNA_START=60 /DNA_END=302 /DNA_ORIENTATION=+